MNSRIAAIRIYAGTIMRTHVDACARAHIHSYGSMSRRDTQDPCGPPDRHAGQPYLHGLKLELSDSLYQPVLMRLEGMQAAVGAL